MSEGTIQKSIVDDARRAGLLPIRINSGRIKKGRNVIHLAPEGTPDLLIVLHDGRCLWIETKTPAGQLRPEQGAVHTDLLARGHMVLVARSRDDFLVWLGGLL